MASHQNLWNSEDGFKSRWPPYQEVIITKGKNLVGHKERLGFSKNLAIF